jgi:hypothetical protein
VKAAQAKKKGRDLAHPSDLRGLAPTLSLTCYSPFTLNPGCPDVKGKPPNKSAGDFSGGKTGALVYRKRLAPTTLTGNLLNQIIFLRRI